ncbi:MAG: hypothetical protein JW889_09810 [Verrucomicrobia bacterium]|nr:hypothetical protein [Verrucomicrobiota bacterium]
MGEARTSKVKAVARGGWYYNPHSGGVKIPPAEREWIRRRILAHAEKHYAGRYTRIEVRFRGQFCYIDAYVEPNLPPGFDPRLPGESREECFERIANIPVHLCRLRYFGDRDRWSMAFYTYSNDTYEPSVFCTGSFEGTPEEGFDTSAIHLRG